MSRRTALAGMSALFLAGCERLGFLAANAPAVFGSYKRHANIAYGPDPQQRLDVYVPESAAVEPRPVVRFLARRTLALRRQSGLSVCRCGPGGVRLRGHGGELSPLPAGQNAGIHARCGTGGALGRGACR